MSKTNRAVKRAAREAEKVHAEVYPIDAGEEPIPEPVEEPPAPVGEPAPEPVEEPPTPVEEPPLAADVEENWEAKYKTLQGMFNAEVPRLQGQAQEMKSRIASQDSLIESMQVVAPSEDPGPALLTPAEVEDYGAEMTDYVKRAAMEAVAPELAALRKENADLKSQSLQLTQTVGNVEADQVADARTSLLSNLASAVPDWAEINQRPEFVTWLKQTDAYTGQIRHNLLLQAFEANDAPRVVAFFEGFRQDQALVSPAPSVPPSEPTVQLNTLVAPGKAPQTPSPSQADSGQRIWMQAEIGSFYKDVQLGRYRGREAEKQKTELAIVAAGREGRIQ